MSPATPLRLFGAVLAVLALTACGSNAGQSEAGSTAQVLPPVIVEQGQQTATARVGEFIVINAADPVATTIETATPELVEISQGYDDGSAVFNPGAKALAVGTAVIRISAPDAAPYDLTVTITE